MVIRHQSFGDRVIGVILCPQCRCDHQFADLSLLSLLSLVWNKPMITDIETNATVIQSFIAIIENPIDVIQALFSADHWL